MLVRSFPQTHSPFALFLSQHQLQPPQQALIMWVLAESQILLSPYISALHQDMKQWTSIPCAVTYLSNKVLFGMSPGTHGFVGVILMTVARPVYWRLIGLL